MDYKVKPTRTRKPDEFDNSPISYEVNKTQTVSDILSYTLQEEYHLQANISIKFWANPAQYDSAFKIAKRILNAKLYGDMYEQLHNARLAVSDGNREAAFRAIDAMQNILESK